MNLRQLPNALTVARMVLVLPLIWTLNKGMYATALWIAVVAGATDALDGWIAKRFGWQTWLGGVLDPVADKLLLVASFTGLWLAAAVPGWLLALVIGRDLAIVGGAIAYNALIGPIEGNPTWVGKATTAAQIALVLVLLVGLAWTPLSEGVRFTGICLVAALTLASGIDYVVRWALRARQALRAKRA